MWKQINSVIKPCGVPNVPNVDMPNFKNAMLAQQQTNQAELLTVID